MPKRLDNPHDLIRVAKQQKLLLWLILLIILGTIGAITVAASGVTIPDILILPLMLSVFVLQILAVIQAFRLTIAMRANLLLPIIMLLGIFIPLLGFIMLIIISSNANTMLQQAGLRVGIMGVPKSEFPKIMPGHCPACGYNRTGVGIVDPCPECGFVLTVISKAPAS